MSNFYRLRKVNSALFFLEALFIFGKFAYDVLCGLNLVLQ